MKKKDQSGSSQQPIYSQYCLHNTQSAEEGFHHYLSGIQ